jgi:hypothetical protein
MHTIEKTIIIIPGVTGPQHRQAGFTAHHLRSLNKPDFYLVEKHKKCKGGISRPIYSLISTTDNGYCLLSLSLSSLAAVGSVLPLFVDERGRSSK